MIVGKRNLHKVPHGNSNNNNSNYDTSPTHRLNNHMTPTNTAVVAADMKEGLFVGVNSNSSPNNNRSSSHLHVHNSFPQSRCVGAIHWTRQKLVYLHYNLYRMSMKNIAALFIALAMMSVVGVQRSLSLFRGGRTWVVSPSMELERECPRPEYETLMEPMDNVEDLKDRPQVCITTLTDSKTHNVPLIHKYFPWRNYDNVLELTWDSKQKYADQYGYVLWDGSEVMHSDRPPAWSKVLAVQALMERKNTAKCDWIMWMDADTLFMNPKIAVEQFLPKNDSPIDILLTVDLPNEGYNSGVWLIRNSEWGQNFMQQWWDLKGYVRIAGQGRSGDNDAFKALLQKVQDREPQKMAVPPRCTFNSFAKFLKPEEAKGMTQQKLERQSWYKSINFYHKGDFIVHVAGYDNKAGTLRILKNLIQW